MTPSTNYKVQFTTKRLGEVLTLQRGYDLPSRVRESGSIPIISSSGITGFHSIAKLSLPAIVTGRYGTIGEVFFIKESCWPLNTTLFVKDFHGNNPKYLSYLLTTLNIKELNSAGAVPGVNRNHLHKINVLIPPIQTQQKIAQILSAYDDLIENNLKCIKLLEEMAQITYEQWFVRMKFPNHETTPIDVETGLPDGWTKSQLQSHISFLQGKKVEKISRESFLNSQKIILLDSLETGNYKHTTSKGHVIAQRGDLLMLMDGARSSYVFYSEKGVVGSTLAKVEINDLPISMMYHFFITHLGWLVINNTGAAIPHANKPFINKINFNLPSKEIIEAWKTYIEPINKSIWAFKDQNTLFKEARDILLPRLMTGMIDVDKINLPKSLDKNTHIAPTYIKEAIPSE